MRKLSLIVGGMISLAPAMAADTQPTCCLSAYRCNIAVNCAQHVDPIFHIVDYFVSFIPVSTWDCGNNPNTGAFTACNMSGGAEICNYERRYLANDPTCSGAYKEAAHTNDDS